MSLFPVLNSQESPDVSDAQRRQVETQRLAEALRTAQHTAESAPPPVFQAPLSEESIQIFHSLTEDFQQLFASAASDASKNDERFADILAASTPLYSSHAV